MESDQSYSGESSSSDSSSGSSDGEEEVLEPVKILGHTLELPQDLCEDYSIFKEFFSLKTWEALDEKHKNHLKKFLPKCSGSKSSDNEEEEQNTTIEKLFNREPFHFTSPLNDFYGNLRQGNYRPDIAKMKKFLLKARTKQQKHKIKSYYAKLLPEVLISRERLLAIAKSGPPGLIPNVPPLPPKPSSRYNYRPPQIRARQRYFEELSAIRSEVGGEVSEDENYPEGPMIESTKKRRLLTSQTMDGNITGTLGGNDPTRVNSMECLKNILSAHKARRHYQQNHPELDTTGITLEDIKQRVALISGSKKLMFGGSKTCDNQGQKTRRVPKKESGGQKRSSAMDGKPAKKMKDDNQNDSVDNKPLLPNIKIKCEREESDSESSSFVDPMTSPNSRRPRSPDEVQIKQEVVDLKYPDSTNINYMDSMDMDCMIKQEPLDSMAVSNMKLGQAVPIKLEDLEGIDMMALPVEIADDEDAESARQATREPADPDGALTKTTHANFLCVVRALFPARSAHRASKHELHARCAAAMRAPAASRNDWYSLSDDWCAELESALNFLAGERGPHPDDFVPYLQFIPETQMYQWIGAGRDCDAILARLCERWLRAASPQPAANEPPPSRYPTSWVVSAASPAEVAEFRAQERKRFAAAAKPFTYAQHGYQTAVGPCARAPVTCSAHSSLLVPDRPRHATFMALVRDAVARLPNGQGTRHDVLTLLKMSQYLSTNNDQALLSATSSALERLHSAKRDPVVKYDQRTAMWTYLHRDRSIEEWIKSTTTRGRGPKTIAVTPKDVSPMQSPLTPMDFDIGTVEEVIENASDSDVDVDDSGSSASLPQLSSAQLLMQATQPTPAKPSAPPTKPTKGKLVPAQKTPKTKQPTPKQTTPTPKPNAPKTTPKDTAKPGVQSPKAKPKTATQSPKTQNKPSLLQTLKQAAQALKTAQTKPVPESPRTIKPIPSKPNPAQKVESAFQSAKLAQSPKPLKQTSQSKLPSVGQIIQNVSITSKQVAQLPKTSVPQGIKPPPQSPKQVSTQVKTANVSQAKTGVVIKSSGAQSQASSLQNRISLVQSVVQSQASAIHSQTSAVQSRTSAVHSQGSAVQGPAGVVQSQTSVVQPSHVIVAKQVQVPKSSPSQHKSPLLKQRPLLKTEISHAESVTTPGAMTPQIVQISQVSTPQVIQIQQNIAASANQAQNKTAQCTRSLLLRAPSVQSNVSAAASSPAVSQAAGIRRGLVRVLSPATPNAGKSLISPRSLLQQSNTVTSTKKRASTPNASSVTTLAQNSTTSTSVVNSAPTVVTSPMPTRTLQLSGGRTVQLSANQTVHLPGGQAVQLAGHTLQLSSLQLPTHSVRLPSGQTVQLASPQTVKALTTVVKNTSPRPQSPTIKPNQSPTIQIPVSTVQIGGQTVQIGGQSVQLTGHTVKLPSGQSVQLASGQNMQTVQLGNVISNQGGQSVQIGSQLLQLSGQTVQLPGGQTIQLPGGQTVQLSTGQTLQLSGQSVQLANQPQKTVQQVMRTQKPPEKTGQPIMAKLLTNAQGQMITLEGVVGGTRTLQLCEVRPPTPKGVPGMPAVPGVRLARPLLLTHAKHAPNIILQQSDGSAMRMTSSGNVPTSHSIVISNIGAQAASPSTSAAPILKLQQVNPIQQVKLTQGIKIQGGQTVNVPTSSGGVRSVLMDGQQLKLVGGRHVLARLLRASHPPQ